MATKKKTSKRTGKLHSLPYSAFGKLGLLALLICVVGLAIYANHLDKVIRQKFDGKRWAIPAAVYARPLELYPGLPLTPEMLTAELELAGYRQEPTPKAPGGYDRTGNVIHLVSRDFHFADGLEKSAAVTVQFYDRMIESIKRTGSGERLYLVRLDPARIGSFHPRENEDRILLARSELPELLVRSLIAVEDRHFYTHFGIDPLAVVRAATVNLRSGETVQGGSTLTQQLVKNFFLDSKRTLWRKVNEALMALLLELHYSKDEILTAYANEIFLGQDGGRAVHGFGLASQFYFRRELCDLSPAQIATLVGLVRGPSFYDPRRNPDRCLQRRKAVLDMMLAQGVISPDQYNTAQGSGLASGETFTSAFNRYPAFLELVRRQLERDYREQDLTTDGLKILTTLDPQVQIQVERQLEATLAELEKRSGSRGLEGAVVVCSREGGEMLALAGGRHPREPGFNRALDAQRPIGSLIKPAVYLTALASGYTLATPVEDTELNITESGGRHWRPANYDRQEHGTVPLYHALAQSYNLATVRVGMGVGVEKVVNTVRLLGVDRAFPPYPSFLLGAAPMSPLEVARMYQTLAAGGFYQPQRAIGSVLNAGNQLIKRYGLSVEQRFPPEPVFLLTTALQRVVSEGTAQGLAAFVPGSLQIAGKTGTSDDLRDSWFAGFSGNRLAVVWVGRDDNQPTRLTGAGGAMVAWGKIMQALPLAPLDLSEPEGIEWARADLSGFGHAADFPADSAWLPFVAGSAPPQPVKQAALQTLAKDVESRGRGIWEKIRGWFQ